MSLEGGSERQVVEQYLKLYALEEYLGEFDSLSYTTKTSKITYVLYADLFQTRLSMMLLKNDPKIRTCLLLERWKQKLSLKFFRLT